MELRIPPIPPEITPPPSSLSLDRRIASIQRRAATDQASCGSILASDQSKFSLNYAQLVCGAGQYCGVSANYMQCIPSTATVAITFPATCLDVSATCKGLGCPIDAVICYQGAQSMCVTWLFGGGVTGFGCGAQQAAISVSPLALVSYTPPTGVATTSQETIRADSTFVIIVGVGSANGGTSPAVTSGQPTAGTTISTTAGGSPSPQTSAWASASASAASSNGSSGMGSKGSLGTSAKIALGVAIPLGVIVLGGLFVFWLRRRRKLRAQKSGNQADTADEQKDGVASSAVAEVREQNQQQNDQQQDDQPPVEVEGELGCAGQGYYGRGGAPVEVWGSEPAQELDATPR